MSETELSASLTLLIGRQFFDGASPERLSVMHNVTVDAVNRAWFNCRERVHPEKSIVLKQLTFLQCCESIFR